MKKKENIIKVNLWNGSSLKNLTFGLKNKGGRNSFGRICSFKKGNRSKRKYRIIDFTRLVFNESAIIRRIEYDPNRTAHIALICYKSGLLSYIISVEGLSVGDEVLNYSKSSDLDMNFSNGNKFYLKDLPIGSIINNIELVENKGAQIARSAGTFCVLLNKFFLSNKEYALVRLSSGTEYLISINCTAVLGMVSNFKHRLKNLRKAGTSRNKGIRPTVRGVAMNPIDHPHGGGEGRKSGRRAAMSPWGKITRGVFTRKFNKSNKFILKRKRDVKV